MCTVLQVHWWCGLIPTGSRLVDYGSDTYKPTAENRWHDLAIWLRLLCFPHPRQLGNGQYQRCHQTVSMAGKTWFQFYNLRTQKLEHRLVIRLLISIISGVAVSSHIGSMRHFRFYSNAALGKSWKYKFWCQSQWKWMGGQPSIYLHLWIIAFTGFDNDTFLGYSIFK